MKRFRKSLIALLALGMFMTLSGCSNKDDPSTEDKPKEETIAMVANDTYLQPVSPTNAQAKAYNDLSAAVKANNPEEEAKQVAISFVYDFFNLSNKKDRSDMGGLEFIPTFAIGDFKVFGTSYYYGNYPTIVNEYGKDSLPEITDVKVTSQVEEPYLKYGTQTGEGYTLTLEVTYAKSKLPAETLKTSMTVTVMQLYDYNYDSSIDYAKEYTQTGSPIQVYRVLSVA